MSERLLARILAFAIFLGAAASLGFGQPAKNSTASTYKTNCVSCHGQDGREVQWARAYIPRIFTRRKFNSSLIRS
jgi:cytochrome c553